MDKRHVYATDLDGSMSGGCNPLSASQGLNDSKRAVAVVYYYFTTLKLSRDGKPLVRLELILETALKK